MAIAIGGIHGEHDNQLMKAFKENNMRKQAQK